MKRNASFNVEEIKVRWKKAALENCTGVPCVIGPPAPPAPSFTCGISTISDIDGNIYETVPVGTRCWTKTNLKVTSYNDGTLIPDSTNSTWGTAMIGARTENKESGPTSALVLGYVGTFGYLYNWYAVNDSRKLCPDGWRVPTDGEWLSLIKFYDPTIVILEGNVSTSAGTVLKSDLTNSTTGSGLGWDPAGSPGNNLSGFSVLPAGNRSSTNFSNIRDAAHLWSDTEASPTNLAWYISLSGPNANVGRLRGPKNFGGSVRCLLAAQ